MFANWCMSVVYLMMPEEMMKFILMFSQFAIIQALIFLLSPFQTMHLRVDWGR